jgi:hypothetical protein
MALPFLFQEPDGPDAKRKVSKTGRIEAASYENILLVVEPCSDAQWRKAIRPPQHRSGDSTVIDGGWIRRGHEFLGISAKVPCDAVQLENGRPRHRGEVSLVGVLFTVVDELDFHLSPHNSGKDIA